MSRYHSRMLDDCCYDEPVLYFVVAVVVECSEHVTINCVNEKRRVFFQFLGSLFDALLAMSGMFGA